ncbi:MAG: CHAD domain-containing protein [Alphaproteobacteria bacterium]|nr:CHAD domain-containing protein [Alphaproteobacteria bacterium]
MQDRHRQRSPQATRSIGTTEACISTEVELKLAASAADLPELTRALVEMAPASASSHSRLISTYYDTPDLALKRQGLTLRVREQEGRFIQTVKTGEPSGTDILTRGEWEDELAESCPDPHAMQSGEHLPDGIAADLQPLFATDVTRTRFAIEPAPTTRIEAAIDQGEIRAAGSGGTEPISEIELELKSGDSAALYDVALQLLDVASLRIEPRSKAERGYRLGDEGEAGPVSVHAAPVGLEPTMTVEAALQEIGRACLAHLLHNEAAALAKDPEGVHQMRVAVRRIRSAISAFKKLLPAEDRRRVSGELEWLVDILGRARNLDVFATELLLPARAALSHEAAIDDLAAALDKERDAAYEQVERAISSERYAAGMLRLSRWFEARGWRDGPAKRSALLTSPIRELAPRLLDRRWRDVRKRSKRFRRLTAPQRHKLRIAAKKLRYTMELLGSLFDQDDLQEFMTRLKRLQDDLGYANDVRVAHDILPELCAGARRGAVARAGARLLEWHEQALARAERKLSKRLNQLNRAAPFWHERGTATARSGRVRT